jgi:membrane protein DedA with SNARE-associated domain
VSLPGLGLVGMVEFIQDNQVLVLFAGILVAGLVVLLPSIQLALQGELGVTQLVVLALLAMAVSDIGWYAAGWLVPRERLRRAKLLAPANAVLDRMSEGFAQTRVRLLFVSRLLYGTRIPTCIACGITRMPLRSFFGINLASAVVWLALLFALAGAVGTTLDHLGGGLSDPRLAPVLLILVALLVQLATRKIRSALDRPRGYPSLIRVSVIIPAFNEQAHLEAAIRSVREQRVPAEVIVVENGSTDGTAAIARRLADGVVQTEAQLGFSRARNLGAALATGDVLVFLDADSRMGPDTLRWILGKAAPMSFGTALGRPDPPKLRYRVFYWTKNLGHILGFYRGALGGLLFYDAGLFRKLGGFDEELVFDELHDLSRRARGAGGRYELVTRAWSTTSMRRFERVGLWSSFLFWVRVRLRGAAGLGPCERSIAYASLAHNAPLRRDPPPAQARARVELP